MSNYAKKTWANGIDAANQTNLQRLEDGVAAVPALYFLTTPYLRANNDSINSGSTKDYACTGVGTPTIPSGAVAVIVSCFFTANNTGAYLQLYAKGATVSNTSDAALMGTTQTVSGGTICGWAIVPLGTGGNITVKANAVNCTGIYLSLLGYVY